MMYEHIEELAELYALGTLSDAERADVDAHVQSCAPCARRLGDAEMLIAQTIAEQEPPEALDRRMRNAFIPARASFAPRWSALVAAAFVLGLLPGVLFAVFAQRPSAFQRDRDRAIAAMVNSHFSHAQFTALVPDAPKAKVLYARGGTWRFFVAQTSRPYTVEAQTARGPTIVGTLHVSGDAGELFISNSNSRSFVLLDGARAVAKVILR